MWAMQDWPNDKYPAAKGLRRFSTPYVRRRTEDSVKEADIYPEHCVVCRDLPLHVFAVGFGNLILRNTI